MRWWIAVLLWGALVACGEESTPLPCDVEEVIAARCRSCHWDPPLYGAPMSLIDWEDTRAAAPTEPSREVWQVIADRVHDDTRPMPPRGVAELSTEQLAVLDAWFAASAPAGDGDCGASAP